MWDPFSFEARINNRGSTLLIFSLFVAAHLAAIFSIIYFLFPPTWEREVGAGIISFGITFLVAQFAFCIGEYFFHRYILHDIVAGLKVFFQKHRTHHSPTPVSWDKQNGHFKIRSCYAIEKIEQDDSATFPTWALAAFLTGIAPLVMVISWLLPHAPILLDGFAAITFTYYLYETLHVIHHRSPAWWAKKVNEHFLGRAWSAMYSFHSCHHANTRCNLNIAGFLGLPLADLIFGTYRAPDTLLVDGQSVDKQTISNLTSRLHWLKARFSKTALR